MSNFLNQNDDAESLRNDLAALKADVAGLVEHLKLRATETVHETLKAPDAMAHKVCGSLAANGEASAKQIGEIIDRHPLLVISASFGLGFIGGRLLCR